MHNSDSETEMRKWQKKGEKNSLRGFGKGGITVFRALEVLGLSGLFAMVEHSVLLGVESKLKGVASW